MGVFGFDHIQDMMCIWNMRNLVIYIPVNITQTLCRFLIIYVQVSLRHHNHFLPSLYQLEDEPTLVSGFSAIMLHFTFSM